MIAAHVPLVVSTRGASTECVHHGSVAVVDAAGRLIASAGDPESLNFTRSALKPLQALPFLEDGGMSRYGWGSQQLAMMCASHNGEAIHQSLAAAMLADAGFAERDLRCGCHPPMYYQATGELIPAGARYNQLANNCSGKHAGFLAFCRLHGSAPEGYLDAGSPLQTSIRQDPTLPPNKPTLPLVWKIRPAGRYSGRIRTTCSAVSVISDWSGAKTQETGGDLRTMVYRSIRFTGW